MRHIYVIYMQSICGHDALIAKGGEGNKKKVKVNNLYNLPVGNYMGFINSQRSYELLEAVSPDHFPPPFIAQP